MLNSKQFLINSFYSKNLIGHNLNCRLVFLVCSVYIQYNFKVSVFKLENSTQILWSY